MRRLSPCFVCAIRQARLSQAALAKAVNLTPPRLNTFVSAGAYVPDTPLLNSRLRRIAALIGYFGALTEGEGNQ